ADGLVRNLPLSGDRSAHALTNVRLTEPARKLRELAQRVDRLPARVGTPVADPGPDERRVHLCFLLCEAAQLLQMSRLDPELQEIARELPDRDVVSVEVRRAVLTVLADHTEVFQRFHLRKIQARPARQAAPGAVSRVPRPCP